MKKLRLILLTLAILAVGFGGGYVFGTEYLRAIMASQASAEVAKPTPPTREELLRLVNEERAKVGVAPLVEDKLLDQSAQWKASDMEIWGYTGHTNHDGKQGAEKIFELTGARYATGSENIAYRKTAKDAVDSWVGSEAHYKAMINPDYTTTGFGLVDGIQVQHFCKPA